MRLNVKHTHSGWPDDYDFTSMRLSRQVLALPLGSEPFCEMSDRKGEDDIHPEFIKFVQKGCRLL